MDWNKIFESIRKFSERVFVLCASLVIVMTALASVYLAWLGLWWVIRRASELLGT